MEALQADTGFLQQTKSLQASFDIRMGQQIKGRDGSYEATWQYESSKSHRRQR
jgi:hypothetical protein